MPDGVKGWYLPGSSVLRTRAGIYVGPGRSVATTARAPCDRTAAHASQQWLAAGIIPGAPGQQRSMATRALLDLRLLTRPDGAVVAAWHSHGVTPGRGSSWVAVALADTGHTADAFGSCASCSGCQLPDGTGGPVLPTARARCATAGQPELDATGWVPWAVWSWAAALRPGDRAARRQLALLWPWSRPRPRRIQVADLRRPCPPPRWTTGRTPSRSRSAPRPLLAGLAAAADLAADLGAGADAQRWSAAAVRLSGAIAPEFGRRWLPPAAAGHLGGGRGGQLPRAAVRRGQPRA